MTYLSTKKYVILLARVLVLHSGLWHRERSCFDDFIIIIIGILCRFLMFPVCRWTKHA